jgi:cytochrome P450
MVDNAPPALPYINDAGTDDFDPWAEEDFTSAHALYADMRARCPVAHSNKWNGFWAFFTYEDVKGVLDSDNFTTAVQNTVPKFAFTGRRPPLHFDPPDHTDYRRVINRFFTREKMARLAPKVRKYAVDVMAPLIAQRRCDIAADYAQKYPAHVFAEFFNLPRELSLLIKEVSAAYVAAIQIVDDETVKRLSRRLYEIAAEVIAQRKAKPMSEAEDLTQALLGAKSHDGEALPEEFVLGCVRQLLVTGMVAPSVFIGNMFVHLSENPDLQDRLRADPSLVAPAVEEYLRLYQPYRGMARTPKTDVVIRGQTIRQNEPIALVYASANRDESVFPAPDKFILDRPNIRQSIAFGGGPHTCPGAPLARAMFRVTLEEALARTKGWRVTGPIKMAKWAEWGTNSVPIEFEI